MYTLSQMTWMTLWGLSFLFVGGFVLWVYGTQKARLAADVFARQDNPSCHPQAHLVQWFFLYGVMAVFAGIGLLLTAAIALI
jgi:hypothetical protein